MSPVENPTDTMAPIPTHPPQEDTPHQATSRAQHANVPVPESPSEEPPRLVLREADWFDSVPPDVLARYQRSKANSAIEERRNRGLRPFFFKCGFEGRYQEVLVAIFEDLGIYTYTELAILCDDGLEDKWLGEKLGSVYRMPALPRKHIESRLREFKKSRKKARNMDTGEHLS